MTRVLLLPLLAAAALAQEDGRAVYREEACWQCHLQGDGGFPALEGTRRAGPVLGAPFVPRSREWHLAHLWDPRSTSADSTMPSWARRFRRSPREPRVREFVARHDSRDGGMHEDGIVTREEYERTGGGAWEAALADLDTGNGVVSLADAAPEPDAAIEALVACLEDLEAPAPAPPPDPPLGDLADQAAAVGRGRALFLRHCAGCHGERGDGNGPAAPFFGDHPPRNFLRGEYKFRSTLAPDPPADADLFRTIRRGTGGGMPGWPQLSAAQVRDLVEFLKSLHPDYVGAPVWGWPEGRGPQPVALPRGGLPYTEASAEIGARVYEELQCAKCHGADGRGDGPAAAETRGSLGQIVRPSDYTRGFKGGADAASLVRTFLTGLQGTPMPSYLAALADVRAAPPADAPFHLAHFVQRQAR